jgi:hypothetical protein
VKVDTLVDAEGTFATVAEVFPALDSTEQWWLPINVVLARKRDTTILIDTGLGPKPRTLERVLSKRVPRRARTRPGPGHLSVRLGSLFALGDAVVHEAQVADPTSSTSATTTTSNPPAPAGRSSGSSPTRAPTSS